MLLDIHKTEPESTTFPKSKESVENDNLPLHHNEGGKPVLRPLNGSPRCIPIGDYFIIGNISTCNLRLDDMELNDRHTRIEKQGDHFLIKDLRSHIGTYLNETKIVEAILNVGDILRIGKHEFQFQIADSDYYEIFKLKSKNQLWDQSLKRLALSAKTSFPILLTGPSGTGKEIIAEEIHRFSGRRGPLISVNCSALTETLIESELFGHVKGSFTGAISDRKGAFETARGGTLFLDEIGDLSYSLQAKLLRALENKEVRPVGSDKNIQTDTRIIAATHQNLNEKILRGSFRSDLYFRLNVVSFSPPALVDRMEDFQDLLYEFAKQEKVRFSFLAIETLKNHSWPGNIRELKNLVARAKAFYPEQTIDINQIEILLEKSHPLTIEDEFKKKFGPTPDGKWPLIKEIEKKMILDCLKIHKVNQRRTAAVLGIPKSTLHDRIKDYGIDIKALKINLKEQTRASL